jgi:hypothetical protein
VTAFRAGHSGSGKNEKRLSEQRGKQQRSVEAKYFLRKDIYRLIFSHFFSEKRLLFRKIGLTKRAG